jgi:hypothetical protein
MKAVFLESKWHEQLFFPKAQKALKQIGGLEELMPIETIDEVNKRLALGDVQLVLVHVEGRNYHHQLNFMKDKYPDVWYAAVNSFAMHLGAAPENQMSRKVEEFLGSIGYDFVVTEWPDVQWMIERIKINKPHRGRT